MKKVLLTLVAGILVLGVIAAAGFAGYRFGYAQGAQASANGNTVRPGLLFNDGLGPRGMNGFGMDRHFDRGFGPGGFGMRGFGFFSLFRFLIPLTLLGLILLFAYWLFTRSGWQFTRTTRTMETQPTVTETVVTEEKEN